MANLALDPAWIHDDEVWRGVLATVPNSERSYYDSIRDQVAAMVREGVKDQQGQGRREGRWMWLFSVREARVSGMCYSCGGGGLMRRVGFLAAAKVMWARGDYGEEEDTNTKYN